MTSYLAVIFLHIIPKTQVEEEKTHRLIKLY